MGDQVQRVSQPSSPRDVLLKLQAFMEAENGSTVQVRTGPTIEPLSCDEIMASMDIMQKLVDQFQAQAGNSSGTEGAQWRIDGLVMLGYISQLAFERLGSVEHIDKAIECRNQALSLTPDGHEAIPDRLNALGTSHYHRFQRLSKVADIKKAIECQGTAVRLTADSHAQKISYLHNLGNSYGSLFQYSEESPDLEKAIGFQSQAIHLAPEAYLYKPSCLNALANLYMARFRRYGDLVDLQRVMEYSSQAVKLAPEGHPHRPGCLSAIGSSSMLRFERSGELEDVKRAIEYQTQAELLTPDGHAHKPDRLAHLGISYHLRFRRLGKLDDVDTAIEHQSHAVRLTPDGHRRKPTVLNELGVSYQSRFHRLGELVDLNRAIECQSQALVLSPDGDARKPRVFDYLGTSYSLRSLHLDVLTDLDQAIEYQSHAARLTPDDHSDKPSCLTNLGNSHRSRYERQGELADINEAIDYLSSAVQLTADGREDKPGRLNNLGISYQCRYEHLRDPEDIDHAIDSLSQAANLTPDDRASKSTILNNLGNSYRCRYIVQQHPDDLEHATLCLQHAAQLIVTSPTTQVMCARRWAQFSPLLGRSPELAYKRCMELIPQLIWLGTTIEQRYRLLAQISDLSTEAAAWAISVQSYHLAIEWLEEGRSIVWNQILQLRAPFDMLSSVDPVLAQRIKDVAGQLEGAGSRTAEGSLIAIPSDLEKYSQLHHRLATEWEQLLGQARDIPGFGNFMRPRKADELRLAAKDGPVVLINTHDTRCDALVLLPQSDKITHLPLEGSSLTKLTGSREQLRLFIGGRGRRDGWFRTMTFALEPEPTFAVILATLWGDVVKPILDWLGHTHKRRADELPHVTWCTSGVLSFLPLHAAGLYDGKHPNAVDLVVSSYTPTLAALLTPLSPSSTACSGVLAVGQEHTEGLSSLPNTVQELAEIKKHTKAIHFWPLDGSFATVGAVLAAMNEYSWVHLACHAAQNSVHPAQSAFRLHDGDLTLETITKHSFGNKGLAFLSACQTATGDSKLPDEAIHLAAGMLMAGYPSVIATMWSIYDADAPEVAGQVYAELLKDGNTDCRRAAGALHKAVAGLRLTLREKFGHEAFDRWVPFIHIGI